MSMSDERLVPHIKNVLLPDQEFPTTANDTVNFSKLSGTIIVYVYPRTSPPIGKPIEGWDAIPGARGCTPQSCGFRDHYTELKEAGADQVFGLSTQSVEYHTELVQRLHLPFPIISDEGLLLKSDLMLPTFKAGGMELYKRLTLIIRNGKIEKIFHPIPSPEQNASDVLLWLKRA